MIINEKEENILSNTTLDTLNNLIKYQNEKLIKHIAKVKGWDEKELLEQFLLNDNYEKKKSIQLNMDKINNSDNDSINSLVFSQFDSNNDSPVLSHSSSSDSLDSLNKKKKRGRPPKKSNSENEKVEPEKKKRGRPKKIKPPQEVKSDQPKRKRGRPKKHVEKEIINDPNVDLQQQLDDDKESIELLNNYDKKIYEEKQKQLKDVMGGNIFENEKNNIQKEKNGNLKLKVNDEDESILSEFSSDEESDVEYEEITCDTVEYQGVQYLLDRCNNNVYSKEEGNYFIGKYDKKKSLIDFNALE